MIGIIGAMELEIEALKEKIESLKNMERNDGRD